MNCKYCGKRVKDMVKHLEKSPTCSAAHLESLTAGIKGTIPGLYPGYKEEPTRTEYIQHPAIVEAMQWRENNLEDIKRFLTVYDRELIININHGVLEVSDESGNTLIIFKDNWVVLDKEYTQSFYVVEDEKFQIGFSPAVPIELSVDDQLSIARGLRNLHLKEIRQKPSLKSIKFNPVAKETLHADEQPIPPALTDLPPEAMIWSAEELARWRALSKEQKDKWYRDNYKEE